MDFLKKNIIIIAFACFFLASFIFLAHREQKNRDYDFQKNWWVIYFKDAKSGNLNFIIENHSAVSSFHWSAISGKNEPFQEGNIKINKGQSQEIIIETDGLEDKKIILKVSDGEKSKEIYKDFRK